MNLSATIFQSVSSCGFGGTQLKIEMNLPCKLLRIKRFMRIILKIQGLAKYFDRTIINRSVSLSCQYTKSSTCSTKVNQRHMP